MTSAPTTPGNVASTGSQPGGEAPGLDLRQLGRHLDQIVRHGESEQAATRSFVQVVRQLAGAVAVLYYANDSTGQLADEPETRDPAGITQATLDQIYALAARTQREASIQIAQSGDGQANIAIGVPVWLRDGRVEVLVSLQAGDAEDRRRLAGWVQILQFLSAYVGQWRGNFPVAGDQTHAAAPGHLVQTLLQAAQADSLKEAVKCYANFMASQVSARFVAIGLRGRGGTCRLTAISEPYQFERGAALTSWLETGLAEALIEPVENLRSGEASVGRETEALRELQTLLGTEHVYRLPMAQHEDVATAASLVVSDQPLAAAELRRWHELTRVLGPQLKLLRAAQPHGPRRLARWFKSLSRWRRRMLFAGVTAVLAAMLSVPLPHRLKCICEVQPVQRRYVSAPYDGRLEVALVEPGDWVQQGQTLARMDSREIETEISGVEAALAAVRGERQVAMSEGDTASAQIAQHQMQTLEVKLSLLKDRLGNLEVRSPTTGVIISGDPTKLEGSRLRMGQSLVEVGPLDKMFLEVAISDDDIAYAEPGSAVSFRLQATPFQAYQGRLVRIHPRAEQREGKNVFIGEVAIDDSVEFRPGMRGHARIASQPRPLAWLVFHRAIEQLLFRLGA